MTSQENSDHTPDLSNSYVEVMLVRLGNEIIIIPVTDVSKVVHQQTLTPVPMAPDHLLGVCNIQGQVICVIDPCQVMSLPYSNKKTNNDVQFIVLRHPKMHLALRSEEVLSLESIPEDAFIQAAQNPQGFFFQHLSIQDKDYRVLRTTALFQ